MKLVFEWDPRKAAANRRKHGVSFDEARTIFQDPYELMIPDPQHSQEEERLISIGISAERRVLVVVYVERGDTIRLISARSAELEEMHAYEARRETTNEL